MLQAATIKRDFFFFFLELYLTEDFLSLPNELMLLLLLNNKNIIDRSYLVSHMV